jgi:hypothetical protein
MAKKSKTIITSLLVVPLMASTILLASPALAADPSINSATGETRHKTSIPDVAKKGISGIVSSVSGGIIVVEGGDGVKYTVVASDAIIMKASEESDENPNVINARDIRVGDAIAVRGEIADAEQDL